MERKRSRSEGSEKLQAAGYGAGAGLLGYHTVRSGVPRSLGVRLESHSTTNESARKILSNGGILTPNAAAGATQLVSSVKSADQGIAERTIGRVYVTGLHPDSTPILTPKQKLKYGTPPIYDPAFKNVIARKFQQKFYKAMPYVDRSKIDDIADPVQQKKVFRRQQLKEIVKTIAMPWRGRSLYVGGSDKYFRDNFAADLDDLYAQHSGNKIRVSGNRLAATSAAIKREGLLNLMGANKGRVAAGLGIIAVGGTGTAILAKRAIDKYNSDGTVKGYKRKTKRGKIVLVKSFKRGRN